MQVHNDGADIVYTTMGKGPDVVLLHPFPTSHAFWFPVAERLAQRYRLILPDLRGHGASAAGDRPATMEKHAADVAAVCRDAGVTRAVFGGISIGGYILFEFWRNYRDQVRALMLCNTKATADTAEARTTRLQAADDVLRRGPDAFLDSTLPKLVGESTRRNRPDIASQLRRMMQQSAAGISAVQRGMAERPDSLPTLPTINVPTLIIAGDEDTTTPLADAQLMQQKIPGSRLQVVPQAGHYAVQEKADDAHRIIRSFLDSLPD
ncbi:MAG TPA: alpha/beta fold hydrolase [Terriglobales bacterium]|nr:alpha/beta fold hydrolase [Terriglobales bacterium]